jgi:hypothetical protein
VRKYPTRVLKSCPAPRVDAGSCSFSIQDECDQKRRSQPCQKRWAPHTRAASGVGGGPLNLFRMTVILDACFLFGGRGTDLKSSETCHSRLPCMQVLLNTTRDALRTPSSLLLHRKSTLFMVHITSCGIQCNIAMGIMIFGYGFLTYETGLRKPHTFLCTATGGWRLHRPVDRPRDLPCVRIDQDNAYILKMGLRREYSRRPRPFQKPVLA